MIVSIIIGVVIASCANMASPSGGDYDFDPPRIVKSTPGFNAVNVTDSKLQIVFDELVQVDNPNEKVIVTPPQRRLPKIQAISDKVIVELRDTLLPNTTYTIDFTDAIADNNEKNALENFSISFSTGSAIDSLAISGKVLTANNLEPVKGIYVGLHSDLNDSAFVKKVFDRISRTNENGEFTIRGIGAGQYRLYALNDPNRSFKYENPANEIAFLDSLVIPSHMPALRPDTVFKQDMSVDTIIQRPYTRFLPDDILLRSFVSAFQRQYLQKHERPAGNELRIYFGGATKLAEVKPLNFDADSDWCLLERSLKNDTLKYWITNPEIIKTDTLVLQVNYQVTDSLNRTVPATDTLSFINRIRPNRQKNDKKDGDKETAEALQLSHNLKSTLNVYDNIVLKFGQPVSDFDESKFVLQHLVDTVYENEKISLLRDTLNPLRYTIKYKWLPGNSYRFMVDSAAFHSYTELANNKMGVSFKIKNLEEYGNLLIRLNGLESGKPAFVELLSSSDAPLRKAKVINDGAVFMHLDPGKYYARIIMDANDNGKWDTGDYYQKIQPEEVYYYDRYIEIKEFFDITEEWNIDAAVQGRQKPLEITKNKPKEKESKRKLLEKQGKTNTPQKPPSGAGRATNLQN
jgi:hypothetical protein